MNERETRNAIVKLQHAIQHVAYNYDGCEPPENIDESIKMLQAAMYSVVREYIGDNNVERNVHN